MQEERREVRGRRKDRGKREGGGREREEVSRREDDWGGRRVARREEGRKKVRPTPRASPVQGPKKRAGVEKFSLRRRERRSIQPRRIAPDKE